MFKKTLFVLLMSPLVLVAQTHNSFRFIENKGQWDPSIKFSAKIPGGQINLHENHISYRISNVASSIHLPNNTESRQIQDEYDEANISVDFLNANPNPEIVFSNPSHESYNFYLGNNPSKWGESCKAYESVTYRNLYPGIDLKFYYEQKVIKYDLLVKPHADPELIQFKYHGNTGILLEDGCINVQSRINTIVENQPISYQKIDEARVNISSQFTLENNTIGFNIGSYQKEKELIIDPELIFSTFSGTVSDNFGFTACFDNEGSLYSGGIIYGRDLQVTNGSSFAGGATDIAILKYDSTGSYLEYATFIGGTGNEAPHSLIVNNKNELIILGTTGSADFPVSENAFDTTFNGGSSFFAYGNNPNGSDIILTKLNEDGNINASTFIGGDGNDGILKMENIGTYTNFLIQNYGDYMRGDVIVDGDDNIYVASNTDSENFPVTSNIGSTYAGGNSDAVIFSMNPDFSQLRWSTYLGGSGDDGGFSIKLDTANHVYIGGGTQSADFPVTSGSLHSIYQGEIDGYITKIDQVGDSILQSTYLGTSDYDQAYFIDIDENQHVFAFGQTRGGYPITPGVYNNPNSAQFIHKLTNNLDSTLFSTVFGNGQRIPNISPTAFLANECGNLFLSGWGGRVNFPPNGRTFGTTTGLPITDDALFPSTDGSDFYIMVLSANGEELLYSTFFGGTDLDNGDHVDGGTSRFDKRGIIYQSVCSCGGADDDFPTTPSAWSTVNRGTIQDGSPGGIGRCNNAAFKFDLASLKARFETNKLDLSQPGYHMDCIPMTVLFENTSIGGEELLWTISDGTERTTESFFHTFEEEGTYEVTLRVTDVNTCQTTDETSKYIYAYDDQTSISENVTICRNTNTTLHASGGGTYRWEPEEGLNNTTTPNPIASPDSTTTYTAYITSPHGCDFIEEVTVEVIQETVEEFEVVRSGSCNQHPTYTFINQTDSDAEFYWDFGDGNTSEDLKVQYQYAESGEYEVSIVIDDVCVVDKTVSVYYEDLFIPNVFTPNGDHINDFFEVTTDLDMALEVFDRNGKSLFKDTYYENDWDGGDLPQNVYYYSLLLEDGDRCNGWVQILK